MEKSHDFYKLGPEPIFLWHFMAENEWCNWGKWELGDLTYNW